jgi:hypothetical protein
MMVMEAHMKTEPIQIVDRGQGPQLNTTRITVMDIFYWIHRGYGWKKFTNRCRACRTRNLKS